MIGSKIIEYSGQTFDYEGEIDTKGKACGFGKVANQKNDVRLKYTYEGTFIDDRGHGMGKFSEIKLNCFDSLGRYSS